jgi:A/G-specific adenine glycosylase
MNNITAFQTNLTQWYKTEARELPWRSDPNPYYVWISEIMLQQTRVDTVIPYFLRFIAEVPTVEALALIDEEKLLKLWQGLGYYNRALNLKKAAQMIVETFGGGIPSDMKDLISLPGIGVYTAGAISSIAFGKAVPAVDGNVLRIIARITASREDIGDPKTKKLFEPLVAAMIPAIAPGDFNQALMDLGATICLPNGEPKCSECPVQGYCESYRKSLTFEIPVMPDKKARRIEKKTVLLITYNDKFALRKRDETGLLPNLWEFPNFEGHLTLEQCVPVLNGLGITACEVSELPPAKHIFTHLEWHMKGYFVRVSELRDSPDFVWATKAEIRSRYSIPTAFKSFIKEATS